MIGTTWLVEWDAPVPGVADGTSQNCATWEQAIHAREMIESLGQTARITIVYAKFESGAR
jgi:hypothetical protein